MKTADMKLQLRQALVSCFCVALEDEDFASASMLLAAVGPLDAGDFDTAREVLSEWEPVRRTSGNST